MTLAEILNQNSTAPSGSKFSEHLLNLSSGIRVLVTPVVPDTQVTPVVNSGGKVTPVVGGTKIIATVNRDSNVTVIASTPKVKVKVSCH